MLASRYLVTKLTVYHSNYELCLLVNCDPRDVCDVFKDGERHLLIIRLICFPTHILTCTLTPFPNKDGEWLTVTQQHRKVDASLLMKHRAFQLLKLGEGRGWVLVN